MTDSTMPRTVNAERSRQLRAYLDQVNLAMNSIYGVTFSEIHGDVDVDLAKLKAGFDAELSVDKLVAKMGSELGLRPASPGFGATDAREYNKRQAALIAYAETTPGWSIGEDGIYAQSSAGVVQFKPLNDIKTARWRFALSAAESSTLAGGDDPRPRAESFGLELVTSQQDIGDAWTHFLKLRPEYADIDAANEHENEQAASFRI
jgi:hypothetical protein